MRQILAKILGVLGMAAFGTAGSMIDSDGVIVIALALTVLIGVFLLFIAARLDGWEEDDFDEE